MTSPRIDPTKRQPAWEGPPCRVLVLDDDELIVRAVTRVLKRAGLTVDGTTDPEEALVSVRRDPPDVVISDLHMPRACGATFLAAIAEIAPSVMRILLSADPDFKPQLGTLAEARVHALMNKSELPRLASVLIEQLRGRREAPEQFDARIALAASVASALSRPEHEDDAHRHRVERWSSCVAQAMGLPEEDAQKARLGAILHDVGQVALRHGVLRRAGRLTDAEKAELADHTSAGARIVGEMPALRDALGVIASHHERQDGSGYPAKLEGEAIPRATRAFQVADAYDAITRGRPFAPRRSHDDALEELTANAGKQHDPEAVRALRALGEDGLSAALRT